MLSAKNNLAALPSGLAYKLKQTIVDKGIVASCVDWEHEHVSITANEALAADAGGADARPCEEAQGFLKDLLADGAVPAKQVRADADAAGLSWTTVKRAKARLGITPRKAGMDGGGVWELPKGTNGAEEAHFNNVGPFGVSGPLRGEISTPDDDLQVPAFLRRGAA
jgi:putative DNA primase/helicase